jgi:competence protein ComEC
MPRSFIIGALILGNIFIWTIPVPRGLTVSFLNVGQGRATLLQGPSGSAVLIDGGPDSSVLRGIGSELPFFIRSLDAVIETNTDAANIGGLPDVFRRYHVRAFIEPGTPATTKAAQALRDEADASNAKDIVAKSGMRLIFGHGAYADIISPGAIRVVYGDTSFLFLNDAKQKIRTKSDVLEVPHYGSKGSLIPGLLQVVAPRYAVLSYACGNRWNYPAPETVQSLKDSGARISDTCEVGTVTFVSDGRHLTRL